MTTALDARVDNFLEKCRLGLLRPAVPAAHHRSRALLAALTEHEAER